MQNRQVLIVLKLLTLVLALSTIQDLLHSKRNEYPFYISESLLFNTFWILFFPMTFFLLFLSRRYAYIFNNKYKSIATIVMIGSMMHVLIYCSILHILSALFFRQDYLFWNNLSYTIANDFYKYPLVYGAIGLFLFQKSASKNEINNPEEINSLEKIIIQKGRESIAILTKDIVSITSSSPYISIQTDYKKYLHTETLKSMLDKLDPNQFVRIHKSSIIQIDKVRSYTSRLNGDYDILMQNGEVLRLSRNYAGDFKIKMTHYSDSNTVSKARC